jgi:putative Holliday junction resolvase
MTAPSILPGRIAAIDYGTQRIGIAISDPSRKFASPLETYVRREKEADLKYFRRLVEAEEIVEFVVGLPLHMSGDDSPMSLAARKFGEWLGQQTGIAVGYFDERYSSKLADEILGEAGLTKKKRRGRRDALAAQVLLTAVLESQETTMDEGLPLDDSDHAEKPRAKRHSHKRAE